MTGCRDIIVSVDVLCIEAQTQKLIQRTKELLGDHVNIIDE